VILPQSRSPPHVAWIEEQQGVSKLFVAHLADTRPGSELWNLDTAEGVDRGPLGHADAPALGSNGRTSFLAWEEGELSPASERAALPSLSATRTISPSVYLSYRYPQTAAWGTTYPPFVRCRPRGICLNIKTDGGSLAQADQPPLFDWREPISIVTSCSDTRGWSRIAEIHFALYDAETEQQLFLGEYHAADGKVYIRNLDTGVVVSGISGAGQPIETRQLIVDIPLMLVDRHGPANSTTVNVEWVFRFKAPTLNRRLVQAINIVHEAADGDSVGFSTQGPGPRQRMVETGFFQVGSFVSGNRVMLPLLAR